MAIKILTSIFGRHLGVDNDGYLVSNKKGYPFRASTIHTLSKSASTLAQVGFNLVSSTGGANVAYTLPPPLPGVRVSLYKNTKSTDTFKGASTAITIGHTTGAKACQTLTLKKCGQGAELIGLSTTEWAVTGIASSTLSGVVTVTTD